jgi:hypothetical protein
VSGFCPASSICVCINVQTRSPASRDAFLPLAACRECSRAVFEVWKALLIIGVVCFGRMGLAHVFAGGCTETNDGCDDTAQMNGPNYNCYLGGTLPNTCPGRPSNQPKFDPVNKCAG